MITLIRLIYIKAVKTKWQFALWYELNKQLKDLVKNPEKIAEIEKKLLPYIVDAIQRANAIEKLNNIPDELLIKGQKND